MWAGLRDEVALGRRPAKVPRAQRLLCAAVGALQTVPGTGASASARPDEGKEAGTARPSRGLSPRRATGKGQLLLWATMWQRPFLSWRSRHSWQYPPLPFSFYYSFPLTFPNAVSPLPFLAFCGQLLKSLQETELMCMGMIREERGVLDGQAGAPRLSETPSPPPTSPGCPASAWLGGYDGS